MSQEESALRFRCENDETVVWVTEGDCCSESWWADGFELTPLTNERPVEGVREIPLPKYDPDADGRTRQEYDSVYGIMIEVGWGTPVFAFRNSSNGYYGGWCRLGEDTGWEWTEIDLSKGEWSA